MPGTRIAILLAAAFAAAADPPGARQSLNGVWQFALAANPAEASRHEAEWTGPDDPAAMRPIPVPANWALHGFEEPIYDRPTEAEGFYRLRFDAAAPLAGQRTILHFGGVWSSAEVWLNGKRLGRHDSGFTAFSFDVTGTLRGSGNLLCVRVRQQTDQSLFDSNDDWALGGIYRDVWIEYLPAALHIERFEAVADYDAAQKAGLLRLRAMVIRAVKGEIGFTLTANVLDPAGTVAAKASVSGTLPGCIFLGCTGQEVILELRVEGAAAWTAETPNLYTVHLTVESEAAGRHARSDRIGFRRVSIEGNVLKLNGRPVTLRGVARHDLHPLSGRATTEENWRQDLSLMKLANINAVRTSHYPPAEGFLRLCDELGMYVIEEIPFGKGGDQMHDQATAAAAYLRMQETLARDFNRPSVIVWSVGNEDPFTSLHSSIVRAVRGIDPSRPVLLPYRFEESLPAEVSILAPHYLTSGEYRQLAARAARPFISTEYNHALGEDFGDLAQRWAAIRSGPAGAGGMIWHWADQGLRRPVLGRPVLDPLRHFGQYKDKGSELIFHSPAGDGFIYDTHGINGADGIVNPDRSPQPDYWEVRAVYSPLRAAAGPLRVGASGGEISLPVRNDYDFVDSSAVLIGWRLMRGPVCLDRGETRLAIAARSAGTLTIPARRQFDREGPYYLALTFHHADGAVMHQQSIRLVPEGREAAGRPPASSKAAAALSTKWRIGRAGGTIPVRSGDRMFTIDSKTGLLLGAAQGPAPILGAMQPVVWRQPTLAELSWARKFGANLAPVLLGAPTAAKVEVKSGSEPKIFAEVSFPVDGGGTVGASLEYEFQPSGDLTLKYRLALNFSRAAIPEAGLGFDLAEPGAALSWIGLGEGESYPNKKEAAVFGYWKQSLQALARSGARSGVEEIALETGAGAGLIIQGAPAFRVEGSQLRLLSFLGGRYNKSKQPDCPAHRLTPGEGKTVEGVLLLRLPPP